MDSKLTTIKETRQFYSAARAVLGADQVADIYKCSTRHIYRWAADPDFCEVAQRNPIDRLISVMRRLCEMGRDDVAHAAVSLMAASVGAELRIPSTELFETGKNIAEECLDDVPALAAYHQALMDPHSTATNVRRMKEIVVQELDENEAAWVRRRSKDTRHAD